AGRKGAHRLLLGYLGEGSGTEVRTAVAHLEEHLDLPEPQKEAGGEAVFAALAPAVARALRHRREAQAG
ncbi:MAG TPA: hypothetical protein VJ955_05765, partial [Desulfuromonadales bacterium]|nr:hypothetical protein [Desulfuromonadales bacterium]